MDKDTPVVGFTDDTEVSNPISPEYVFNSVASIICVLAWLGVVFEVYKPFGAK